MSKPYKATVIGGGPVGGRAASARLVGRAFGVVDNFGGAVVDGKE